MNYEYITYNQYIHDKHHDCVGFFLLPVLTLYKMYHFITDLFDQRSNHVLEYRMYCVIASDNI